METTLPETLAERIDAAEAASSEADKAADRADDIETALRDAWEAIDPERTGRVAPELQPILNAILPAHAAAVRRSKATALAARQAYANLAALLDLDEEATK